MIDATPDMPAPKKKKSNISGLRNQGSNRPSLAVSAPSSAPSTAPQTPYQSDLENAADSEEQYTIFDSLRNNWEAEENAATDSDIDSELGSDVDWDMDESLAQPLR